VILGDLLPKYSVFRHASVEILPKNLQNLFIIVVSVLKCSILAIFCSNISNYIQVPGRSQMVREGKKIPGVQLPSYFPCLCLFHTIHKTREKSKFYVTGPKHNLRFVMFQMWEIRKNGQQCFKAATSKRTMVGGLLGKGDKIRMRNKYLNRYNKMYLYYKI